MKTDPLLLSAKVLRLALLIACLIPFTPAHAQEKPASPEKPDSAAAKFPEAKKAAFAAASQETEADENKTQQGSTDKDGPDALRKRDEWFYKQRASANGRIPAGARLKAFQHMQRMMEAEGKLIRRPDGTFAEITRPEASTSFPAWTSIGPTPTTGGTFSPVTGRITTIAVDPSDPNGNTVLIGGAQGGVWRSTDAGVTWTAVGDQNASLAMGSIAFAPSQAGTVYAGTGEQASIGFDIYYGAGVLKSTDGGQTWTQTCTIAGSTCPFIGPYNDITPFGFFTLGGTRISYVAVSPTNAQRVLVAAQTQFAEGTTEGLYCSDNAGATWSNILPDEMATFAGFASASVAFVALGNPFGSSTGAPNGNGIYKSINANAASCSEITFTPLAGGLPAQSSMGRMELGISPNYASDSTVYVSIADATASSTTNLGVWVTSNGGTTWTQSNAPDVCQFQCWYDNVIKVDPNNKDYAFFGGSSVSDSSGNPSWVVRTANGGTSWTSVIPNQLGAGLPHVDTHALAFFKLPTGKVRLYMGNDGGIWRTDDAEATPVNWTNLNGSTLTLTQFYPYISINTSSPAIAFGGTQDNGSQNYQGAAAWVDNNLCGDGSSTAVDPSIPSTVYIGCATGAAVNVSYQNGAAGTFSPAVIGINAGDSSSFIPPIAADPNSPGVLYFGTTRVYQSVDAATTWTPITTDLGFANNGEFINTLSVAPTTSAVVYAGGNTGRIFQATGVIPGNNANFLQIQAEGGMPNRSVSAIAADPSDASGLTVYVAFSGFSFVNAASGINDAFGHIFKQVKGTGTWTDVSCSVPDCSKPAATDLPNIPVNDLVVDPDVPGTIYAATDLGVYIGNCAATPCMWSTLGTGLPRVAVLSLRLHEASRTLRAATHGRGVWDIALNNLPFAGPRIFSITPTSANAGGGQFTITVTGTGLTGGTIQFGTTPLSATGTSSDTSLSGTVPSSLLTSGTVKVTVAIGNPNPTATSNALPFPVLASTPTLTSINPPSTPVQTPPSPPLANIPIQLTGTNFGSNSKILFNGAYKGITTTLNNSTSLSAILPLTLLGPYGSTNDITVLGLPPGGGKSQPTTFKVVAPPPPNDSFVAAINITSLTYLDVKDSSGATSQSTDALPPITCIQQYTSAQGNTGGEPNGVYNTVWYQFTPPFSANLDVDTIGSNYDTVLSIWTGSSGNLTPVACNDDIVPGINIQSQLTGVPLTVGTTYYIMVSSFGPPDPNPIALGGRSQLNFSYNSGAYPAATLTSISPASANSGDPSVTLSLVGSNFFNGAVIDFANSVTGQNTVLSTTFVSSTKLTALIPASAMMLPASFNVDVSNPSPNAGASNILPFIVNLGTYPVPTLSSIVPTTIIAGSFPFQLFAGGTNFASSAVINFNGVAKSTTDGSPTTIFAVISTTDINTPGTVQVTVTNPPPGGGTSAPQSFVITQPTVVPNISSVNPASVVAGASVNLTINGTGFTQGAFLNVGGPGGNPYATTFVSSTQLFVPNFIVIGVGAVPIYVIDAAPAGTSAAFNLTVTQPPPPTITSISPTTAQTGSALSLTISGTNFQPNTSVLFNNQNGFISNTNIAGTTQITANLALAGVAGGTYPVTVINPGPPATSSNPVNFIVTGPPDFSFTVATGQGSQTVNAGQTATFNNAISVTAMNGFTGQVVAMCTSPAQATTCSVMPSTINAGQSANIVVTTTARGLMPPQWWNRRFISWPRIIPVLILTILLGVMLTRLARTHRQRLAVAVPLAGIILFVLLQAVGCGGGGYSQPPSPTGTQAGTYTITVTGTSATTNTTHTATLQLVVN